MTERKQLNLKLRSDKLEKWQEHQESNPEYSSMTDLIRTSVEREIAGTHGSNSTNPEVEKELAEIKDMFRSFQNDIDALSSVVSDLQRTVKSEPTDKHLRSEIFAALPSKESMKGPQTAQELSEELGPVDSNVVAQTLESLADDVSAVERVFHGEEIHYQKKE